MEERGALYPGHNIYYKISSNFEITLKVEETSSAV
jgi:hypothetical protein